MKQIVALVLAVLCASELLIAQQSSPLPHLEKTGKTAQMIVDGRPFLMLSGELHNSSASNAAYMRPVWTKLTDMNLNTVIGTVSWELVEPVEGQLDFSSVDMEISEARHHGLKLILIWFGIWKSTSGSYAPMWVKTDRNRFPVVQTTSGHQKMPFGVSFEGISVFGENIVAADVKAFRALMRHIREVDPDHTVIMMQVENETGMFGDNRDHTPLANAAWLKPVPRELLTYMTARKATLTPELLKAWESQGFKTEGTWAQVFGTNPTSGEIFMAWHLARAVETVTEAGKGELSLPMYTNGWLGPVANMREPGEYPSGGPTAGMLDVWRVAAPQLDFVSPNVYSPDFQGICAQYDRVDNPLFIPETYVSIPNLFWAVGHYAVLGYSPFGIDNIPNGEALGSAYRILGALAPLILGHQSDGKVMGVIQGNEASVKAFEDTTGLSLEFGDVRSIMVAPSTNAPVKHETKDSVPPDTPAFGASPKDTRGFAIVVRIASNQFVIAGSGVVIRTAKARLGTIDELVVDKGQQVLGRRLNGDETFSGNLFTLDLNALEIRKVETYTLQ